MACDPCAGLVSGPCLAPVELEVRDAITGMVVSEASATGPHLTASCVDGRCSIHRSGGGARAGDFEISVSATGYEPKTLRVVVPEVEADGCFHCGYEPVSTQVHLVRS